jgi:predicted nuclease of predicted toxin-antitoxin system
VIFLAEGSRVFPNDANYTYPVSRRPLAYGEVNDVRCALDVEPRASDEALLDLALEEERVLVTEDKDFGELVFVRGLRHPGIVRFVDMRVEEKVAAMRELIERHPGPLQRGALIVVTRGRVRIRERV